MQLATLRRKVKRQFGDEYDIVINDQDIYDWCNESQVDIVRSTTSNDVTTIVAANLFPIVLPDRVAIKRVTINNKALTQTTLNELDDSNLNTATTGQPSMFYYEGGNVGLYPKPNVGDVYNVLVTYAVLPVELHLLAPYFQFRRVQATLQQVNFGTAVLYDSVNLNDVLEVTFDNPLLDSLIATRGTGVAAATLAWRIKYVSSTNSIELTVSNGTTIKTGSVAFLAATTAGMKRKFRVKYVASTGIFTLSVVNTNSTETVQGTNNTFAAAFSILSPIVAPILFGGFAAEATSDFKLHYFQHSTTVTNDLSPILTMDGSVDLVDIPTTDATIFNAYTGQTGTVTGSPTLLQLSADELTVLEVYHEDVVRYCIARAHDKNQNYRGADAAMESYQQGVSTRRNEADNVDAPIYKQNDPGDFEMDWFYA